MPAEEVPLGEYQPFVGEASRVDSITSPRTPVHGNSKVWSPSLPLLSSHEQLPRKRRTTRYVIAVVVIVVVIVAVVCAAVFATRHKHSSASSSSPDSSSSPGSKTPTPGNTTVQGDLQTMTARRLSVIVGGLENSTSVPEWYVQFLSLIKGAR